MPPRPARSSSAVPATAATRTRARAPRLPTSTRGSQTTGSASARSGRCRPSTACPFIALAEAMAGGSGRAVLAWSSRESRLINQRGRSHPFAGRRHARAGARHGRACLPSGLRREGRSVCRCLHEEHPLGRGVPPLWRGRDGRCGTARCCARCDQGLADSRRRASHRGVGHGFRQARRSGLARPGEPGSMACGIRQHAAVVCLLREGPRHRPPDGTVDKRPGARCTPPRGGIDAWRAAGKPLQAKEV